MEHQLTYRRAGYFDPAEEQPYRQLEWDDVDTQAARDLAYRAAVEGIVLLKNDGTLPLKDDVKKIALVGPWANVSNLMQGNYYGASPYLVTPYFGALNAGYDVALEFGTAVSGNDSSYFEAALEAAKWSDAIVFTGGLDQTVESEARDRLNVTWPGLQLELISKLQELAKPLVVVQFGGGQVDSTVLKESSKVSTGSFRIERTTHWHVKRSTHCSGVDIQGKAAVMPCSTFSPERLHLLGVYQSRSIPPHTPMKWT